MALTGPFSVEYPVNFYSGGDTTKEAFGKHIQEIQRIYGLINSLNADKVSASEVTNLIQPHINSTDPHPNWIIDLSRTTGNLATSRLSGNINASLISGTLSSSVVPTLSTSKISGLENYIKTITSDLKMEVIISSEYEDQRHISFPGEEYGVEIDIGAIKLNLINGEDNEKTVRNVNFLKGFSNLTLPWPIITTGILQTDTNYGNDVTPMIMGVYTNNFTFRLQDYGNGSSANSSAINNMYISYIAIGASKLKS